MIPQRRPIFSLVNNVRWFCSDVILHKECVKPYGEIPGPTPVPIVGNIWRFLPYFGEYHDMYVHEMMSKIHNQYGNIVLMRGLKIKKDVLYIFDPKDMETVYTSDDLCPIRDAIKILCHYRDIRPKIFKTCRGLFCSDGDDWHQLRSKINPIAMKPTVIKNYTESASQILDDFIRKISDIIEASPNGGQIENLELELSKLTFEIITFLMTSMRLGFFTNESNPKAERYIEINRQFFKMLFDLEFTPTLWKYFSTPTYKKAIKTMDTMGDFVRECVESFQQISKEIDKNPRPLLEEIAKHGEDILNATAIDFFLGGVDTTQRAFSTLLYFLAVNPQVQNRLREEVIRQIPQQSASVTHKIVAKCSYLKATVKEVLRLMPIAPVNARCIQKDMVLSGYYVPKDTHVILGHYVPLHADNHFPQAGEILPDRWLRSSSSNVTSKGQWSFAPFGFGPRSCIGKRLAMLEIEVFLIKVIRNFKLEWRQENEMKFTSYLLAGMAAPLEITFVPVEK